MTGLFADLARRFAPGATPDIRPRPRALFEPTDLDPGPLEIAFETTAPHPIPSVAPAAQPPRTPAPIARSAASLSAGPPMEVVGVQPPAPPPPPPSPPLAPHRPMFAPPDAPAIAIPEVFEKRTVLTEHLTGPRSIRTDAATLPRAAPVLGPPPPPRPPEPRHQPPLPTHAPAPDPQPKGNVAPPPRQDPAEPTIRIGTVILRQPAAVAPPPPATLHMAAPAPRSAVQSPQTRPHSSRLTEYLGWKK